MFYESDGLYNDEREYAEEYTLGSTMSGRIEKSNDVDCYKVYLRPGHLKYTFTVPSGMNYRFKVYREGSSDTDTFICEDDNPCAQTRSGEKDISISEADTYYICISFHVNNKLFDTQRFYNFKLYYTELTVLNFNQKYNGYEDVVNSSGCALCCAADLTSFYKGSTVTVNDLKSPNYSIKDNQSIYYEGSSICNFDVTKYFILTKNSSTSNLFSIVKAKLKAVILFCSTIIVNLVQLDIGLLHMDTRTLVAIIVTFISVIRRLHMTLFGEQPMSIIPEIILLTIFIITESLFSNQ